LEDGIFLSGDPKGTTAFKPFDVGAVRWRV